MTDIEMLAAGIHNAAVRLGMIEQGTELTGPQCLMLLGNIEDMAAAAQPEFKATATRIVYRPKRGRKGVMCITSWMPLGDFPPNVGEVLEETVLYEKTKPAISIP